MSREILFRGKTNHNKWIYGFVLMDKDTTPAMHFWWGDGVDKRLEWRFVKEETIGQYTGLKDKNGVKIFEWDIVKDSNNKIWTVCYDNEYAMFSLVNRDEPTTSFSELSFLNIEIEVIGNIHDNPELLERRVK